MGFAGGYRVVVVSVQAEETLRLLDRYERRSELDVSAVPTAAGLRALLAAADRVSPVDVLLMDIELGSDGLTGIDVVRELVDPASETQVIYTTGFMEYCQRVYETSHAYFLVKPVDQQLFDKAMDKALKARAVSGGRFLKVQIGRTIVSLQPKTISCVESARRKVRFHTMGEVVEAYAALRDVAARLPDTFIRCHGSYLVNMEHIAEMRKDCIVLRSSKVVPISQPRYKATREAFMEYLDREA